MKDDGIPTQQPSSEPRQYLSAEQLAKLIAKLDRLRDKEKQQPWPAPDMPAHFEIKPGEFMAIRWTGDNFEACKEIAGQLTETDALQELVLPGELRVPVGHWIVRNDTGDLRPYSPEAFKETYEPADNWGGQEDIEEIRAELPTGPRMSDAYYRRKIYTPVMKNYLMDAARPLMRSREDREDLVQEAFQRLAQQPEGQDEGFYRKVALQAMNAAKMRIWRIRANDKKAGARMGERLQLGLSPYGDLSAKQQRGARYRLKKDRK